MEQKTYVLYKQVICPGCKKDVPVATGIQGRPPKPGDYSMCFECGTWLVFKGDLSFRIATEEDIRLMKKHNPVSYDMMLLYTKTFNKVKGGKQI